MASRKIRDIVAKVGEYTDRNTGETKGRFENVGALMQNDDGSGSYFIMLKRTFNPAGIPGQDTRESVLLSCYEPKPREGQPASQSYASATGRDAAGAPADLDDEIPFAPEWR